MDKSNLVARWYMNTIRENDYRVAVHVPFLKFKRLGGSHFVAILGDDGPSQTRREFRTLREAQDFARRWLVENPDEYLAELFRRAPHARALLMDWIDGDRVAMQILHDAVEDSGFEWAIFRCLMIRVGCPVFVPPGQRISFAY